jgi:hypothetical protein
MSLLLTYKYDVVANACSLSSAILSVFPYHR